MNEQKKLVLISLSVSPEKNDRTRISVLLSVENDFVNDLGKFLLQFYYTISHGYTVKLE